MRNTKRMRSAEYAQSYFSKSVLRVDFSQHTHSVSLSDSVSIKIVEDIRKAFLVEIRCCATLAIGIPRRDSPKGHSLLRYLLLIFLIN